jgi:hypothetical protein
LNTFTSLFTHEFDNKPCLCGTFIAITLVRLSNLTKSFSAWTHAEVSFFSYIIGTSPYNTNIALSKVFKSEKCDFAMFTSEDPGFAITSDSNSSSRLCFSSAAKPLTWLSPKITIFCFVFLLLHREILSS